MPGIVTVTQLEGGRTPVVIFVSKSVAVPTDGTLLMTIHIGGTLYTTAVAVWPVPPNKTFRVNQMNMVALTSAVLGQAQLAVILGTAAASVSVTSTVGIAAVLPYAIQASTTPFSAQGLSADIVGGTTVGLGVMSGTSHTVVGAVVQGYLF
jgi:hypothetical protein